MPRFLMLFCCLFAVSFAYGQLAHQPHDPVPPELATNASLESLKAAVQTLDQDPGMRSASWSITVLDAATGKALLTHNSDRSLATASTMKAVTTATALEVLGADFRFETVLEHDGMLDENGTLDGNLYIRGDGDPTLGSDRFSDNDGINDLMVKWAKELQARGIKQITGKIIADASVFSTQMTPSKWPWEDIGNYYGAGACGLNIHENLYRLDLEPGPSAGSRTKVIRTDPVLPEIAFVNELMTGSVGSGDQAYIYGAPYTRLHYLRGTIPAGKKVFSIKGSIPDPALFAANRFLEEMYGCGISVHEGFSSIRLEKMKGTEPKGARKPLHVHQSRPLREIIRPLNMNSINLYAEAVLNRIAVKKGKLGSTENGVRAVEAHWKARGVNVRGMSLRDGSGLSPNNVLSTYQLASILAKVQQSRNYEAYNASLPVAGKSGSLKRMCKGTAAEGNVRAKSGFISGVRGYTGYVESRSGRTLAFAMIGNHFSFGAGEMGRRFEKLMVQLALVE